MSTPTSEAATQGFVPVPEGQLYFERAGEGPAVVLIHSAFLDRREWDAQFRSFARGHTVVRYDVRGHGRSAADRTLSSDAEDVAAVLDHLGLTKAFVLGSSDGARIASEFAAGLPDRVMGLVLVAGAPHDLDPTNEEELSFLDTFADRGEKLLELIRTDRRDEAIDLILEIWAPQAPEPERARLRPIIADNYTPFVAWMNRQQPPGRRPAYPVAAFLRERGPPILSIVGVHDNPALAKMMGRFAAETPTAHHVELAEGDHLPSISARAEFDRLVLGFLDDVSAGRPWPPPPK
jgi:3-oxoadipate enol-lactonase